MKNPTLIGTVAPHQIGDTVCSLPVAHYIKKIFPNSYSVAVLDPRSKELAPLLLNHPDIDRIYINQQEGGYTEMERKWASTFDFNLPLFGHFVFDGWAKTMSWMESNFRVRFQFQPAGSPLLGKAWDNLTENEKKPKLEQWFEIERFNKLIVLAPFVGYDLTHKTTQIRSPSLNWWQLVVEMLLQMGFAVAQIGMLNSPLIYNHINFYDKRNLSLLESTKLALGADLFIGACGGMSYVINAYGQKTICLYTDWIKNASSQALLPVNYKDRMIPVFGENDINSISLETIREAVCQQINA